MDQINDKESTKTTLQNASKNKQKVSKCVKNVIWGIFSSDNEFKITENHEVQKKVAQYHIYVHFGPLWFDEIRDILSYITISNRSSVV